MKILLHVCCGPCATGALEWLRRQFPTSEIAGLFYNPNIYPESEYQRRRQTMERAAGALELPLLPPLRATKPATAGEGGWAGEEEGLVNYLHQVAFREKDRCRNCYAMRLAYTARQAAAAGHEAFSTTLLISPYQNLEAIRTIGEALSKIHGPDFVFHDLRPYFSRSRQRARELGLYQQKYCGCIFSELERIQAKARGKGLTTKTGEPQSSAADLPGSSARPFTLPGLDPEATARLLSAITGLSDESEGKWRPWGKG